MRPAVASQLQTWWLHMTKFLVVDMEDYHWANFTNAMEFFQEWASFKKKIPKHFFIILL